MILALMVGATVIGAPSLVPVVRSAPIDPRTGGPDAIMDHDWECQFFWMTCMDHSGSAETEESTTGSNAGEATEPVFKAVSPCNSATVVVGDLGVPTDFKMYMNAPNGARLQFATPHGVWETDGPPLGMPAGLTDPGPAMVTVKVDLSSRKDYALWRWRVIDAVSEESDNECHFQIKYEKAQTFPAPAKGTYEYSAQSPCYNEEVFITAEGHHHPFKYSTTSPSGLYMQFSKDKGATWGPYAAPADSQVPPVGEFWVDLQKLRDAGSDEWYWQVRDAFWEVDYLVSNICPFRIADPPPPPPAEELIVIPVPGTDSTVIPLPGLPTATPTPTPRVVQNDRLIAPTRTSTPTPRVVQNDRIVAPTRTSTPRPAR